MNFLLKVEGKLASFSLGGLYFLSPEFIHSLFGQVIVVELDDISFLKFRKVVFLVNQLDLPPHLLAILLYLARYVFLLLKVNHFLLLDSTLNHVSHLLVPLSLEYHT